MGRFGRVVAAAGLLSLLLFFALRTVADGAVDKNTVTLDAEKVIYDDETGTASAEGGALLSYGDVRITADRIDYDDETGRVVASSPPDTGVVISNNEYAVRGDRLEYNIATDEGVLVGARTSIPIEETTLHIRGSDLQAVPDDAADGRYVFKWDDVSLTTCKFDHPHYRFEAKRFVFTPGRRVVVKKPRVFLGNTHVFTYPFDYIINVQREKSSGSTVLPKFSYSGSKGFGVALSGPFAWQGGKLELGAGYWTKVGFEGAAFVEQKFGENFTANAGIDYTWDKEWERKMTRPSAILRYDRASWFSELRWRRNEYIESQKTADFQFRGLLETQPEILVGTKWLIKNIGEGPSWNRLLVSWGSYRETLMDFDRSEIVEPWRGRLKFTAESYGEGTGSVAPFWWMNASTMLYDIDRLRQDIVLAVAGFRYKFGGIAAGSAYRRRWVRGDSPMYWDYEVPEEKIYQMFDIPLGGYFSFGVWGGYDMKASFVSELNYSLKYQIDCMVWELLFRDDRNAGGEKRVMLRFGLTGTGIRFEGDNFYNPFLPPKDLPKPSKKNAYRE